MFEKFPLNALFYALSESLLRQINTNVIDKSFNLSDGQYFHIMKFSIHQPFVLSCVLFGC